MDVFLGESVLERDDGAHLDARRRVPPRPPRARHCRGRQAQAQAGNVKEFFCFAYPPRENRPRLYAARQQVDARCISSQHSAKGVVALADVWVPTLGTLSFFLASRRQSARDEAVVPATAHLGFEQKKKDEEEKKRRGRERKTKSVPVTSMHLL